MIDRESMQRFRQARTQEREALTARTSTKQRIGLAQRESVETVNDIRAASRATREAYAPEYNPASGVNSWYDGIASLRDERTQSAAERASSERSTTGAMDVDPLAQPRPQARWDGPTGMSGGAGGRAGAEQYLGREMSDEEWEMLARTTYAESTSDPEEQAAVMSVILNRVKADGYPNDIVGVVTAPNQFQAVTGTANNPRPSSRFQAFNDDVLAAFETEVTPRLGNFAEQNWLNFTAGNLDAYGEGTNPGFLDDVNKSEGSARIGGTVFGTVRG